MKKETIPMGWGWMHVLGHRLDMENVFGWKDEKTIQDKVKEVLEDGEVRKNKKETTFLKYFDANCGRVEFKVVVNNTEEGERGKVGAGTITTAYPVLHLPDNTKGIETEVLSLKGNVYTESEGILIARVNSKNLVAFVTEDVTFSLKGDRCVAVFSLLAWRTNKCKESIKQIEVSPTEGSPVHCELNGEVIGKENEMILIDCGIPVYIATKDKFNKGGYIRAEGRLDAHLVEGDSE